MTKRQAELLAQLRHAREIIKASDPSDVALVRSVYDAMLHRFGNPEFMESLSDEEYAIEWSKCRHKIAGVLISNGLITENHFSDLWYACDTLSIEQAIAFT